MSNRNNFREILEKYSLEDGVQMNVFLKNGMRLRVSKPNIGEYSIVNNSIEIPFSQISHIEINAI